MGAAPETRTMHAKDTPVVDRMAGKQARCDEDRRGIGRGGMPRRKVKGVGGRLAETVDLSRSAVYRWLRDHHSELAAPLSVPRPPWKRLAQVAADDGIRTRAGDEPSHETLRTAWRRLERDLAAAGAVPVQARPPPPRMIPLPSPTPPLSRPVAPAEHHRPKVSLRPSRALRPGERPQEDGSHLPRPIRRNPETQE